jgi:hypothetical protein
VQPANIDINLSKKVDPGKQLINISLPAPVETEVIVKDPRTVEASVKVIKKGQLSSDGTKQDDN